MAAVEARCSPMGDAERGPLKPAAALLAVGSDVVGLKARGLEGSEWGRRAAAAGDA